MTTDDLFWARCYAQNEMRWMLHRRGVEWSTSQGGMRYLARDITMALGLPRKTPIACIIADASTTRPNLRQECYIGVWDSFTVNAY